MMEELTYTTQFLILSDTHDTDLQQYTTPASSVSKRNEFGVVPLPAIDVVLHCGDLTNNGGLENHQRAVEGLASMSAELKLVIPGNHDIDLDRAFMEQELRDDSSDLPLEASRRNSSIAVAETKALWTSTFAQENGIRYLEEGDHLLTLMNGSSFTVHASPYTPQFGVSAFRYPTNHDRFCSMTDTPPWATNVSTKESIVPAHIDILMTHGPPKYILDTCDDALHTNGGCEHLRSAVCATKPRLHCFGHIHNGWGARVAEWKGKFATDEDMTLLPERFVGKNSCRNRGFATLGREVYGMLVPGLHTLFVNAAVGSCEGRMENVPWVVELELAKK